MFCYPNDLMTQVGQSNPVSGNTVAAKRVDSRNRDWRNRGENEGFRPVRRGRGAPDFLEGRFPPCFRGFSGPIARRFPKEGHESDVIKIALNSLRRKDFRPKIKDFP